MTAMAYMVIWPCADARMGDLELGIAGVFLSRPAAEKRLAECLEELAELEDPEDDPEQPYIYEMEIG